MLLSLSLNSPSYTFDRFLGRNIYISAKIRASRAAKNYTVGGGKRGTMIKTG